MLKLQNTCVELLAVNASRIHREPFFRSLVHFDRPNYSEVLSVSSEIRGTYIHTIQQLIPLMIYITV